MLAAVLVVATLAATNDVDAHVDVHPASAAHDACIARSLALDFAAAIAVCQLATDDAAAPAADRVTAFAALAESLAVLGEKDLAAAAFVHMLVLDDSAAIDASAGPPVRAAFEQARAMLARDGAVHAHVEAVAVDGVIRVTVSVTSDPMQRVRDAREIDERGPMELTRVDDSNLTVDVAAPPRRISYRVELLGPARKVVPIEDALDGFLGDDPAPPPSPAAPAVTQGDTPTEQPSPARQLSALSIDYLASMWSYSFDGGGAGGAEAIASTSFVGASAHLETWPATSIPWLGIEGDVSFASLPFSVHVGGSPITPSEFTTTAIQAAVAFKARYALDSGVAFGARAGYRFYGADTVLQFSDFGGDGGVLTVVPGYTLHAAVVGAEAFVPLTLLGRSLELEARGDVLLPLVRYVETPDNPGGSVSGFGWAASFAARFELVAGFFAEARLENTGTAENYAKVGSRVSLAGDAAFNASDVLDDGGLVLNDTTAVAVGVGVRF